MTTPESKPLKGKTVLVTRAQTQDSGLENRLTKLGAKVFLIPTITIDDPDDWNLFDQAASQIPTFDWILFTSANAVSQTKKRLDHLKLNLSEPNKIQIAAVGKNTAEKIQSLGWPVHLVPDDFQAEGLLKALCGSSVKDLRFWFPRALKARDLLAKELKNKGAEVILTPAYQNRIPLENKELLIKTLQEKTIDWITFTSSSTATNFFLLLEGQDFPAPFPKLASIGKVTTETINQLGKKTTLTADPQNFEGLCQAIKDWEIKK